MTRAFGRSDGAGGHATGETLRRVAPWVLLLGVAAALRWLQWTRSVTLFNDGPRFLAAAQDFARGDWGAFLAQPHHPLFPIGVAAGHALGLDWERAAALLAVLGGTAAVGVAALFFRDAFGTRPAWIGATLLAVHSRMVEYSSDVQTDGLYLGLFGTGLWFLWRAWTRGSVRAAALGGAFAGLAYLTRPEGVGLVVGAAVLAGGAWLYGAWPARRAFEIASVFALMAALCAAPYVIAVRTVTGQVALTQKKSVVELAGGEREPIATQPPAAATPFASGERLDAGEDGRAVVDATSRGERAWEAARMLTRTAKSAFRYGALALLAAGLVAARGRPTRRAVFVAVIALLYGAVLYALTLQSGYVSRRHALPALVPLFGYVGIGACALGAALSSRLPRAGNASALLAAGVAAIVAIGELATQREPRRSEERAARAAAEWLRANAAPGLLATDRSRLGYYAGMPYIALQRVDEASLASLFDRSSVLYLLSDDPDEVEALKRAGEHGIRPIHRVRVGEREAWVFERVEPAPQESPRGSVPRCRSGAPACRAPV